VQVGGKGWREEDGIVAAWLARHGAIAALVRPDHYVYGVASTQEGINALAASFDATFRE
jgi:3-(3-hydroxy-phenyl)propionate hydroxylase